MQKPFVYDPEGQARRRREVYDSLLPLVKPFFPREGEQVVDNFTEPHDMRLRLWIATGLLAGGPDDIRLGDEIVRNARFNHACHFCMAWTFSILHRYEDLLAPETIQHLDEYVQRYLVDLMTMDYHFHGANDNAPANCAAIVILAGERYGEPSYVDFGRERLSDLDFVLDRRGTIFECNSPTYSATTLAAVAELAEFAQDEEVRRIALRAEQRIWQEVALAFHPETRHQMGPYSRAYEDDLLQHSTDMTYALYQAVGPVQPTHTTAMLLEPVPSTVDHNSWDFARATALRSATPDYHIAPETAELFLDKPLPFRMRSSNEFMASSGFPGTATSLDVYMTPNYGLGTFGSRVRPGQPTAFSVSYRRQPFDPAGPVEDYLASVRTVFCRYVISEEFNGMMNRAPENPAERNREFISDRGAGVTIQQDNTALVSYRPAPINRFTKGLELPQEVRTLKLCIVFPQQHSQVEEVWLGDQRYPGFSAVSEEFVPVYVKDGPVYFAFYPLVVDQFENMLASLMLETQDDYGIISLFNMCGFDPRPWDEQRFPLLGNGFVCEIGDQEEWGSFEAFRRQIFAEAKVQDLIYGPERRTCYQRPGRDLALAWDVYHCGVRYATIDRQPVPLERLTTDSEVPLVGL